MEPFTHKALELVDVANWASTFLLSLSLQITLIGAGYQFEKIRPAGDRDLSGTRLNVVYLTASRIILVTFASLSAPIATLFVNALGGGLIVLPDSGWGIALSIPAYALAMDAGEYLFHRAQHKIPWLWAMHSLHHSDPAVNISTAPRHFWGDYFIKTATIYLLVGVLFKANTVVLVAYFVLNFYNYFLHMNTRVGFGRWSVLLNNPQFHRLHHSALPEHADCNFNQFFPVFDLLFGTYRQPKPDEYPPTGLADREAPVNLYDMLLWPWRRHRLRSTAPLAN